MGREGLSHLRGKYAIQQRWVRFFLKGIDAGLKLFFRRSIRQAPSPRRLLIVQPLHLGDVVLLTALLAPIQSAFGNVEIGLVVSSASFQVVKNHPKVAVVHTYDHWRHNRSGQGLFKRVIRHLFSAKRALKEIQSFKYDTAIVLSPFFANGAIFSFLTGIRTRIGYTSGGFGPLFTHPVSLPHALEHITDYHLRLLQKLEGFETLKQPLSPELFFKKEIKSPLVEINGYILISMGAGAEFKKWPYFKWRELSQFLLEEGYHIVLVGSGEREVSEAAALVKELGPSANIKNYCGRLNWSEFVATVEGAKLVICHDSVLAHVASHKATPTVVLFSGVRGAILNFYPLNKRVICLCKSLPCNPCFMVQKGCASMECIREIQVNEVVEAARQLMGEIFDSKREVSIL